MKALLWKELLDQWRNHRLLVVAAVLVVMGILGPVSARYMNELMTAIPGTPPGLEAVLPIPTPELAVAELVDNLAQFGLILALLVPMGAVVGEKTAGTAAILFCKPVSRWAFLLAKVVALLVTFAVGTACGVAAGYAYTGMLFEWLPPGGFALLASAILLYLLFYATLSLFASALMRSQLAAAGMAFGLAILVGLLGTIPAVGAYLPGTLLGWARTAATGIAAETPWKALAFGPAAMLTLLTVAWLMLRRQEL